MTNDIRPAIDDTPVEGIDSRVDQLLNERFRSLAVALIQLQQRTIIEPRAVAPLRAYDGQIELADGVNWNPADIPTGFAPYLVWHWNGTWHELLDDRHLTLTPPLYLDDPHGQYWHKIKDSAWAHMFFQDFATPKVVPPDGIVTGWTGNILSDWQLVSDPVLGTITIQAVGEYPHTGTYFLSISGFIEGTQNTNYVVTMYADGVATAGRAPVILKGNATNVPISWAGLVHIDDTAVLDLRLESSSTASNIEFYTLNWCMHRINPIAGSVGGMTINGGDLFTPPTIPPDWGDPGMGPP